MSIAVEKGYNDENLDAYDYYNQSPLLVSGDVGVTKKQ